MDEQRSKKRPLRIIGHRGASGSHPENTMAAFQAAFDIGSDGVEMDVRLTRDGVPVICHDRDLTRIAGKPDRINQLTWRELRKIDAGTWFSTAFTGERIPSLERVLDRFGNRMELHLELKWDGLTGAKHLVSRVIELLRTHQIDPKHTWLSSFQPIHLFYSRLSGPKYPRALIVSCRDDSRPVITPWLPLMAVKGFNVAWNDVNRFPITRWKRKGHALAVWTVADPSLQYQLAERGFERIITDNPEKYCCI
jgi:glycerophosphoryl diester phosphodiesterase